MGYWKRLPFGAAYQVGGQTIAKFESTPYNNGLDMVNNVFTGIFAIEMLLKFGAWGFKQ